MHLLSGVLIDRLQYKKFKYYNIKFYLWNSTWHKRMDEQIKYCSNEISYYCYGGNLADGFIQKIKNKTISSLFFRPKFRVLPRDYTIRT